MSVDVPATHLRLGRWDRPVDEHDRLVLDRCLGPTLDVGCGPGRFVAALAEDGRVALGIDVLSGAVDQTRDRGAAALCRDVFDAVPGEGRWETVLLADGNIGIGGDPEALLRRLRQLLDPRGRVVVELSAPGTPHVDDWATLESADGTTVIRWSVVGIDAIEALAARVGLEVVERIESGARWWAVLEEAAA